MLVCTAELWNKQYEPKHCSVDYVIWNETSGTYIYIYIYMYMYIILPQTSNSERRKGIFYSAKRPARSDTNPPPYVMGTLISSPGGGGGKAAAA